MTTLRQFVTQRWLTGLVTLLVLASLGFLFRGPLFRGEELLFRDGARFYPPLWEWARAEWGAGRVPLWDPYQNLGEPHLAENTSSVFYPAKLLFALPFDFQRLYVLFLVGHVLLAALTMFRLVRSWGGSVIAGGMAALSYSLSGNVLFQYCNVPFLIGAAWLPWAIDLAWRLLSERSVRRMLQLAIVLAIMILGGDTQMVVNIGLALLLLCAMRCFEDGRGSLSQATRSLLWVGLLATVVFCLAAIQVLPTWQQTRRSERVTMSGDQPQWLARPNPGSHASKTYHFSVGPWRWAELCWANVGGRMFPIHSRWMSAIPAEGRVWSPSLYFGLLPFALTMAQLWQFRRLTLQFRWIALCGLLSALAALGRYGVGWLIAESYHQLGLDATGLSVGWPFGGLYWLLAMTPMYGFFRYPAKLWVLATCGFSLLAAHGWDGLAPATCDGDGSTVFDERARRLTVRGLALLGWLSAGLCLVLMLTRPWLESRIEASLHTDAVFGRLDAEAGVGQSIGSLAIASGLAAVFWWLLRSRSRPKVQRVVSSLLLLICGLDLVVAQHWLVVSGHVPRHTMQRDRESVPERAFRQQLERRFDSDGAPGESLLRTVEWERATLLPQYQHASRTSLLDSPTTIPSRDMQVFLDLLAESMQQDGAASPLAKKVGIDRVIDDGRGSQVRNPLPRAWIARDVRYLPELARPTLAELKQRTRDIWLGDPSLGSGLTAFVAGEPPTEPTSKSGGACQILTYSPQRIVIESRGASGLLILGDQFAPGWRAWVRRGNGWDPEPILRSNRVLRGVWLRGDEVEVVFQYVPLSFYGGAMLSVLTWCVTAGWLLVRR